jgi:hypothetical protein
MERAGSAPPTGARIRVTVTPLGGLLSTAMTPRRACWICSAVLYGVGLAGVVTLGRLFAVNHALLVIAVGSGFLIAAVILGARHGGGTSQPGT